MSAQTFESRLAALEHARSVAHEEAAAAWRAVQEHPVYLRFQRWELRARLAESQVELARLDVGAS